MATTIGTSTNLSADERVPLHADRADGGGGGAPVHVTGHAAAAPRQFGGAGHEPRRFLATLRLDGDGPARDRPLAELRKLLPTGLEVREDRRTTSLDGRLVVGATHEALEEAMRVLGATAAPAWLMQRLRSGYGKTGEDLTVFELSVTSDSGLIGRGVAVANVAGAIM